ncbi:gluconate:H+ symporter [Corynebacterium otitidis]|uniref:GntT/GntP/DsdX family permease n=1 Tax=Corynebacterium otitidis TaxID=29321 RepID=UPI000627BC87|nr:gluconate:H+ symporter [Corynebacterium otitidis]KKO82977.1 transporter [Corynebacterium otitidis]
MSAVALLAIAALAVAALLALVLWVRLPAFVALLIVAVGTALAAGLPLRDVVPTIVDGVGGTLGQVVLVVGLGAMLGRALEVAGGARSLAESFTARLGRRRVAAAVTAAAFVLGIPVFFDVGFIILAPVVFGFAAAARVRALDVGLPVAAAMIVVHVALPPHPGPVAAAGILGVDAGRLVLVALPICALAVAAGFYLMRPLRRASVTPGDGPVTAQGPDDSDAGDGDGAPAPRAWVVVALVLLPLVLIMGGTAGTMLAEDDSLAHDVLGFVGAAPIALLVAVLAAHVVLGRQQGWSLKRRGSVFDSALPAVATIVFVTGAGGAFAEVLVATGIGEALSSSLAETSIPLILMGYLIAAALRVTQGSASVAILTAAGLVAQPLADAGLSPAQAVLVLLALCFGAAGFSHVNDSGFWIVTSYLGLGVKDGLKTWTVASTIVSVVGLGLTLAAYALTG